MREGGTCGTCGRGNGREARRSRSGAPRGTEPEADGGGAGDSGRSGRARVRGAKRQGGQAAAPGVVDSRTLLSCKNRYFAGGAIGPDTATAGPRNAALTIGNSTLTLG